MTKEKDTLSERRGSLKMESSSLKTGNVAARASRSLGCFLDVHCTTIRLETS